MIVSPIAAGRAAVRARPAILGVARRPPPPAAAAAGPGQHRHRAASLKAALTGEPDRLDPAISSIYTGAQVYDNIFSKLIDLNTAGEFVPRLATAWTQTDRTTWTFDLVDNAYFHNGEPFTSADVKYTFERILDPATASSLRSAVLRDRLDRDADADAGRLQAQDARSGRS